jgi:lysophospholipase L1-like esterase
MTTPAIGAVANPCGHVAPMPAEVSAYFEALARAEAEGTPAPTPSPEQLASYHDWQAEVRQQDFAQICKYEAANAALGPASARRVVYFGDSITELWALHDPDFFADDVINRGISGQTTLQMLGRFRADVIDLKPRVVHIIAGTNDVAGNTGPTSVDRIVANLATMIELARLHGVRVVLGSQLPCARYQFQPHLEAIAPLAELNRRLRALVADAGLEFVDYFTPLADAHAGFDPRYSDDGLHPGAAGYAVMAPLARAAVERTLASADRVLPNLYETLPTSPPQPLP